MGYDGLVVQIPTLFFRDAFELGKNRYIRVHGSCVELLQRASRHEDRYC